MILDRKFKSRDSSLVHYLKLPLPLDQPGAGLVLLVLVLVRSGEQLVQEGRQVHGPN